MAGDADAIIRPLPEEEAASSQWHDIHPGDWLKIGFYFALGVMLLLALADATRFVLVAALAIIAPFIVGVAFALLLDPLVERVQRVSKMPRAAAAIVVFVLLIALLITLISLVVPDLIAQATSLSDNGPAYLDALSSAYTNFHKSHPHFGMPKNFSALEANVVARATALIQSSSGKITDFLISSATVMVQLVLSLIITLFLLIDLKRLRARLMFLAPSHWRAPLKHFSADIGGVFSDYVRGLIIVCVMFSIGTTILLYALSLVHHSLAQYALLVGVLAGALYAVPYLGSITTTLLVFVIGFASGGAGFGGITVVCSLVLNQIFDNIITPKVVGGGVGLHPVVALFSLVLGGELFGIAGMLLSVPIAASIQVVLFRLVPKSNAPTPETFLAAQGIPPQEAEAVKIDAGEDSKTERRRKNEKRAT